MSRQDIGDELLTLLAAGHETTASTLGWAFERITRHPAVLSTLVEEAATDDNEYRQATILEVQRARTVIDFAGRHVYAPTFELGDWVIPRGYSIVVAISQLHDRADDFPAPERFDPQRYIGTRPPTFAFVPFGGGTRRCVGAVFANVEMDVVLRTVLRHFVIDTTTAPDEKAHSRGCRLHPQGRRPHHRAPPRDPACRGDDMTDATTVDTEAPSASGHTAARGAPAETGPDGPFGRLPPLFSAQRGEATRLRLRHQCAVLRPQRGGFGPRARAEGVPGKHRRPDQRPTQPQPDLRTGFGLRAGRQGAPQPAASCWPRRSTGRASATTRRSSKRRRCARRRHGPRAASSPRSNR